MKFLDGPDVIVAYVIEIGTDVNGCDVDTRSAESFDRLEVVVLDGNILQLKELARIHIFEDSAILLANFVDHADSFIEYDYKNNLIYQVFIIQC